MIETKILLIDDEKDFVSALEKRLSKRGMKVRATYSGEQGLTSLKEDPDTDVVLLDVKMPGMDGISTLREIKKLYPLVEVVMLTGHGTVESAIEGMKVGAFDFLMKPCELEELVSKVDEAKKKRRSHLDKIIQAAGKELRSRIGR
jgi:DNA-binding NtrC family response regulator